MAIRFDKTFNAEISRRLSNVNKKFARASKAGYARVPQKISIREFKAQFSSKYSTRREMRRALTKLEKANVRNLSQTVDLSNGGRITQFTANLANQERIRTLRFVNKEIKRAEAIVGQHATPFERKALEDLYSQREMLQRKDITETMIGAIHKLHSNIFSAKKKEAFEHGIAESMKEQIKMTDLSAHEKEELMAKIESADVNTLIKINRKRKEFATILDRYKPKDEYNSYDEEIISKAYRDIYENIDSWIEEYSE